MVIAIINGGFANQLYRYACAYATAKKYSQQLIIIAQTTDMTTDPFQLGEFQLEYSEMYIAESYMQEIRFIEEWKKRYKLREVKEDEYFSIMTPDIFEQYEGIILYGTYQNQKFFEDYIVDLRRVFQFEKETSFLKSFKEEIADKQSVAVHVRRGDFLTYDGLTTGMEFYKAAMCAMEDKIGYGKAEYYIFSDDKDFIRSFFGRNKRIHYIQVYGDFREAVEEFMALSSCSHRILTIASSFSRMADALNTNRNGYAIYEQSGFSRMVFWRENLLYLDSEAIAALAGYYAPIFERDVIAENFLSETEVLNLNWSRFIKLCMDTRDITKESEIVFRIRKIELLNEQGNYAESLGQARKLWELAGGTKFDQRMHELYWECLYKYGLREESLIEATFLPDIQANSKHWYNPEEQRLLEDLNNVRKDIDIVLVPSRRFDPCLFENMIHAGKLLRRLGYGVTFMFWEPKPDSEYYQPYKKTLKDCLFYEDVMGHNSRCPMINLTEKENEYGTIKVFFDIFFGESEKIVLISKQRKILSAADDCIYSDKIINVFWDYSNPDDLGNYEALKPQNYGVSMCRNEMLQEEIPGCYAYADYIITYDKSVQMRKPVLKLEDYPQKLLPTLSDEKMVADFYKTDSVMVNNVFSIVRNLLI